MATVTTISISNTNLTFGNGGTYVITGSNNFVTFGSGVTVTIQGANNGVNAIGGSDTITLQGLNSYVGLIGGAGYVVYNNVASDTVNLAANTTATVFGLGGVVGLLGSNDSLIANNLIINTVSNTAGQSVFGSGDTINGSANLSINVSGGADTINLAGTNAYLGLLGGTGYVVNNDFKSDTVNLAANTTATVAGMGGVVGLLGSGDVVFASNLTINTVANTTGQSVFGSGDTINGSANLSINVGGGADTINLAGTNAYLGLLGGTGYVVNNDLTSDTVNLAANTSATVFGLGGTVGLLGSNDTVIASNLIINTVANTSGQSVFGSGDTINGSANLSINVSGGADTINLNSINNYLGLLGGTGYVVTNDVGSDTVNLAANTTATVIGLGGTVGLLGSNDTAIASNLIINTVANTSGLTVLGSGDTINGSANLSINVGGGADIINLNSTNNTLGLLSGSGYVVNNDVASDTVLMLANTSATVNGAGGGIFLAGNGVSVISNNETISAATNSQNESVTGSGNTIFASGGTSFTVAGGADTIVMGGANNYLNLAGGNGYAVFNDAASDLVDLSGGATAQVQLTGGALATNGIGAVYNTVLDRDPSAAELTSAQSYLAMGGSLNGLMGQLAGSAELQADLASTYAAVGAPAPSQAAKAAFADVMSTSYRGPITLFSIDPGLASRGFTAAAQTVLANTSATNLLAELPALETEANGVNLGLQLADGTQITFANTAGLATFLYAVAVQQMQATSFVTANYNLDVQWLNTVDQPLLDKANFWREMSAANAAVPGKTTQIQAIEANVLAHLALQIASEAPLARQVATATITNQGGTPTQLSVYPNGASYVHDVDTGAGGFVGSAASLVLNVAAVVFAQPALYAAAAALDAAQAGQAFSNGQDFQALLSLAQAGGNVAGALGAANTQVILNTAVQGVGGVYGAVQGAQSGNVAGLVAGALEAAAATATGIGLATGTDTQAIAKALGSIGLAANLAGDFASGNLGQGLIDSLNLYLPAIAQDYTASQTSIAQGISAANISPTPDMLGLPQHIAFVGGFFDSTTSGPVYQEFTRYKSYALSVGVTDVQYFTWDQAAQINQWGNSVNQSGGQVTIIGHSWGGDTVAKVVANGLKVQTLVTLDPVSYFPPSFKQVSNNSGQWLNYVATGGGLNLPNAIAGIGSPWNNATQGYATSTVDVSVDHAAIAGQKMFIQLLGH